MIYAVVYLGIGICVSVFAKISHDILGIKVDGLEEKHYSAALVILIFVWPILIFSLITKR